ncbi:MAG: hypothetical protein OEU26_00980 [Candidatus Tectomicrobia bacterium]|nr:hypothetical protein [Candidatus Tectomicrobia bacterium]
MQLPNRIRIRIADLTIALESTDPTLPLQMGETTARFRVADTKPDVCIRASWKELPAEQHDELMFDSGGLWQLYNNEGSPYFRFASPVFGAAPYKAARFSPDFAVGDIWLRPGCFASGAAVAPLEYPLDELLMLHLLAQGRGMEVHACGVIDAQGRGHVFIGQSGAGKTTLARLWEATTGVTILSDDRIILRYLDDRFWMYGTPWHGEAGLACAARAPLTHIVFLRHASHNALIPQRPSEAISRLLACSFPPFYSPDALAFTMQFCAELVDAVPCDEFAFLPDPSALSYLQRQLTMPHGLK